MQETTAIFESRLDWFQMEALEENFLGSSLGWTTFHFKLSKSNSNGNLIASKLVGRVVIRSKAPTRRFRGGTRRDWRRQVLQKAPASWNQHDNSNKRNTCVLGNNVST
jgi:hypothetical protein